MATDEAEVYYYEKGKQDYNIGFYDQPFPSPMALELDEFEMRCNKAYKKGYCDGMDELKTKLVRIR
ncbi:MAG: hypothetical protein U0V74_05130 [Chitinophagales bacterium]